MRLIICLYRSVWLFRTRDRRSWSVRPCGICRTRCRGAWCRRGFRGRGCSRSAGLSTMAARLRCVAQPKLWYWLVLVVAGIVERRAEIGGPQPARTGHGRDLRIAQADGGEPLGIIGRDSGCTRMALDGTPAARERLTDFARGRCRCARIRRVDGDVDDDAAGAFAHPGPRQSPRRRRAAGRRGRRARRRRTRRSSDCASCTAIGWRWR